MESRFIRIMKKSYRNVTKFLAEDLWKGDFSELGKMKRRMVRYLRTILVTFKGFSEQRFGREAVAMSYHTLMAVVPLFAVIMYVSNGFGFDKKLSEMLYSSFPTSTQMIDAIMVASSNIIDSIHKGWFGWISFLLFVWLVIWLFWNIERDFNRVWNVRKSRNILQRMTVYTGLLIIAPFLMIAMLSGYLYYIRFIEDVNGYLGQFSFITTNLLWIIMYIWSAIVFSVMYKFIPHTFVRFGSAIKGSLVSAAAFVTIEYFYLATQLFVARMSAVYGAFAAVPLFLVFMNLSWFIILFGAQLSNGFQQVDDEFYREDFENEKI